MKSLSGINIINTSRNLLYHDLSRISLSKLQKEDSVFDFSRKKTQGLYNSRVIAILYLALQISGHRCFEIEIIDLD